MGKSNKFDYSRRPSAGAKLGGIIGRDVEKEADKVQKDFDKQATKARKTSNGSTVSSTISVDVTTEEVFHTLDIKVVGRQIGDEGASAMAEGLEKALRKGNGQAAVLLEDLNLADNGLTTASLARLAPVIELACNELKTLNLAKNNIEVKAEEQAEEWEAFLQSFKQCRNLRRLDLSGNVNLGSKALEIMAKVHTGERDIDATSARGDVPVQSLEDSLGEGMLTPNAANFTETLVHEQYVPRRCGLRSLPYLTLNNVGLNSAGALWLSYIIEDHHYPNQLIDERYATPTNTAVEAYQQPSHEGGIEWQATEPDLGKDGKDLLQKAEAVRAKMMLRHESTNVDAAPANDEDSQSRKDRAAHGDRRPSLAFQSSEDSVDHEIFQLVSLRRKVQRSIIEQYGASSVELWRTAIRIATASRMLANLGEGGSRKYYTGQLKWRAGQPVIRQEQQASRPTTPANGIKAIDSGRVSRNENQKQGTYAAILTADTAAVAGEPEIAITEATNSPATPKMISKSHRDAFSHGNSLQAETVTKKLEGLVVRDADPQRYVDWQEEYIREYLAKYGGWSLRKTTVDTNLPDHLVDRIAKLTGSVRVAEGLTNQQRQKLFGNGRVDRVQILMDSKKWTKMSKSLHCFTWLEKMECLEYQRD